jgi:hypothetical protein
MGGRGSTCESLGQPKRRISPSLSFVADNDAIHPEMMCMRKYTRQEVVTFIMAGRPDKEHE